MRRDGLFGGGDPAVEARRRKSLSRARLARPRKPLLERLLSKRVINPHTECWLWTGAGYQNGYGEIYVHESVRRVVSVHRAMASLACGLDLTKREVVRHTCDERRCFNPEHLRVGSQKENLEDMVRKGRSNRGERSGRSKLDEATVRLIIRLVLMGQTRAAVSRAFNISWSHVHRLVTGKNWRHLHQTGGASCATTFAGNSPGSSS
jgi:hypothetical protein